MTARGPLARWVARVSAEFGLDVDGERATRLVLDLARDVAHQVDRPAAPVTAYLLGLAAAGEAASAGGAGSAEATERAAERVRALLADWPADGGA